MTRPIGASHVRLAEYDFRLTMWGPQIRLGANPTYRPGDRLWLQVGKRAPLEVVVGERVDPKQLGCRWWRITPVTRIKSE